MADPIGSAELQYFGVAFVAALFGTVARAQKWLHPDDLKRADGSDDPRAGKVNMRRMVTELVTAPAIAFIASGIGFKWNIDPQVMAALAAALGLVGAAFISGIIELAVKDKAGSILKGGK